jgi:ClpP class serine protease
MSHSLYRLRGKLFNTPQLMEATEFETIVEYINKRCEDPSFEIGGGPEGINGRYSYNQDLQVAVMSIEGPLSYKPVTFMGMKCGGTDYQTIKEDFTYLAEQGVRTVAFEVDSPGGEAFQLFPTAKYVREVANEYGINILAYVDGLSASAAYGFTAIADEVIVAPSSEVGSIGVVVRLMNDSKALEKAGMQRTFVTAGKSKVPFDEDGGFKEDFIQDIQSKVDVLYEEFTEFVAMNRNISVETVRSTEAKTFLPVEAIELGLIDRVMTVEEFYTYLADEAQTNKGSEISMFKNKLFNLSEEETQDMTQLAELAAELEGAKAQLATYEAAVVELASIKELTGQMQAALEAKEVALAEALEQVKELKASQEATKAQSRKEKLSAVLAVDKVESVQASLESLSDEAFETVVASFATQKDVISQSELMTEVGGVSAEDDNSVADDAPTATEKAILARLNTASK